MQSRPSPKVVIFDAECALCSWAVRFIIARDPRAEFVFAAAGSDAAREMLAKAEIDPPETGTMMLIEDGRVYTKSTSSLRIARRLRGVWPLLYAFIIVPQPVRDWAYSLVSKNRYRWSGQRASCEAPTAEMRARLLK